MKGDPKEVVETEIAAAVLSGVRLGIDEAVYRRQEAWRSFPATLMGVDLYALKIELEKCIESGIAAGMRIVVEANKREQAAKGEP
jgi:hypothetical protein